jgi:hypothetical protein
VAVLTCDPGTVNTKMLLAGWGPCGVETFEAGAYTRSHFRSTLAYFAPFRSTQAYLVPHITQINPWMCPEGAQVEL